MKKLKLLSISIVVFCFCSPASALNITLDGRLNDWGVKPFKKWKPDSLTADYKQQNNTKGPRVPNQHIAPPEYYDIEGLYFDNDDENFYFALVSSSRADAGSESDLAFDFGGDGKYEIGIGFQNYTRTNSMAHRNIYEVDKWVTNHHGEWHLPLRINHNKADKIGKVDVFQRHFPNMENSYYPSTYIIEGAIPIELIGLSELCNLPINIVYTKVSCLQDSIRLKGTCNGDCGGTEVPEPSVLILFTSGLLGLGRIRKRNSCKS